ncbi:hypothetical protein AOLI_G00152560 [Acnodon oligacanthus]
MLIGASLWKLESSACAAASELCCGCGCGCGVGGQILKDLFGSEISSLLLAQPDITEGSAQSPVPSETTGNGLPARSVGAEPHRAVPRFFLDFLSTQRKLRGRSRKSPARGCFGMKVDRIGALSGLGC